VILVGLNAELTFNFTIGQDGDFLMRRPSPGRRIYMSRQVRKEACPAARDCLATEIRLSLYFHIIHVQNPPLSTARGLSPVSRECVSSAGVAGKVTDATRGGRLSPANHVLQHACAKGLHHSIFLRQIMHVIKRCASSPQLLARALTLVVATTLSSSCFAQSSVAADSSGAADFEDRTARLQTTYVWQNKPAMRSLYSGTNSLDAGREKSYTATITGYLGFRPWQGGELYLNPEVTQGVPFSGMSGSAAFTNGEVTRTAGTTPTLYRQRLFLRQTWGLGGGDEKLESDLNQMAGSVDRNRFVLTLGNFSSLDVFDDNRYAKDPRVHFMNAGFMAPLAYDYAADARGFGWGFAGEWYQDDWVLRFGRMTGPKQPNMLPVDYQIGKHYGDQVEIERGHLLWGQPGKVRLLGWRNRANTASFKDALDYLQANPSADPQAILAVRNGEKLKYGLGVNVEQAISDNLGFFLRAMKADGKTETYAFTETDGSLATGFALKGAAWGRADDTLGVGFLHNTLSQERRAYLAAGGISFFIGDGGLNYRPEQVFETYYSLKVWKSIFVSADYQRMWNPAYNADRGPANFFAARFHAEF
jgi:hypothetical protein